MAGMFYKCKNFMCVNLVLNFGWVFCMQLRHLRDQSRQLESQLCKMQHDMISKEQDLSILHTRLQQMNPEDPQYVCANVLN